MNFRKKIGEEKNRSNNQWSRSGTGNRSTTGPAPSKKIY